MNFLFAPTSRYYSVGTITIQDKYGNQTAYLERRFVPPPERFAVLQLHTVTQDERLDNITAQYMDDPEQFWRLCDANRALRPDALTETPGRQLRITLPEGIPGTPNA